MFLKTMSWSGGITWGLCRKVGPDEGTSKGEREKNSYGAHAGHGNWWQCYHPKPFIQTKPPSKEPRLITDTVYFDDNVMKMQKAVVGKQTVKRRVMERGVPEAHGGMGIKESGWEIVDSPFQRKVTTDTQPDSKIEHSVMASATSGTSGGDHPLVKSEEVKEERGSVQTHPEMRTVSTGEPRAEIHEPGPTEFMGSRPPPIRTTQLDRPPSLRERSGTTDGSPMDVYFSPQSHSVSSGVPMQLDTPITYPSTPSDSSPVHVGHYDAAPRPVPLSTVGLRRTDLNAVHAGPSREGERVSKKRKVHPDREMGERGLKLHDQWMHQKEEHARRVYKKGQYKRRMKNKLEFEKEVQRPRPTRRGSLPVERKDQHGRRASAPGHLPVGRVIRHDSRRSSTTSTASSRSHTGSNASFVPSNRSRRSSDSSTESTRRPRTRSQPSRKAKK